VHVPDGFIDAPTSVATAVVAGGAVAVALRKARTELDERTSPMAGLVAAFVFATQMLNFPVGAGTSGHLLGGALAAVLVGPWTAMLCMSVVLLTQALLFADGGLTALGTNITLMGVVAVITGWAAFRLVTRLAPASHRAVVVGTFLGALVSVPVASVAFVGLYELGGTADIPLSALLTAMLGWHVLIGIGEALITALTVSSVLGVRPDLVYGARGLRATQELELRTGMATGARP
jgi:cobalt/nickel transport system permease protein